jgi:hypothetical protein
LGELVKRDQDIWAAEVAAQSKGNDLVVKKAQEAAKDARAAFERKTVEGIALLKKTESKEDRAFVVTLEHRFNPERGVLKGYVIAASAADPDDPVLTKLEVETMVKFKGEIVTVAGARIVLRKCSFELQPKKK